jgi:hypothetical protein
MALWTVSADYMATGEGQILMAIVCQAHTKEDAFAAFVKEFGDYYAICADVEEGISHNRVIKQLFSDLALSTISDRSSYCSVSLRGSRMINGS